jgi:biotin transporter BioY
VNCVLNQCYSGDLRYLLLQINVISLLLALIGTTVIVKHPNWFGAVPVTVQSLARR